ncbi:uncharacterized protein VTP21DRAFT_8085 [Calcarisporiella thermophila]|uniref:uncharacterized protein n=1 Tax=Calcarisporiella thermophila TaxID=911321 RepID=UPI00374398FB
MSYISAQYLYPVYPLMIALNATALMDNNSAPSTPIATSSIVFGPVSLPTQPQASQPPGVTTSSVASSTSSTPSSGPGLDFLLRRCSICFDAQLDFCLAYCRDQFCRECFKKYVTEVVYSSWGIGITKIKCPVCGDILAQSEWSKYVDPRTVELYNKYNTPYRSLTRYCPRCGGEVVAATVNSVYGKEKELSFAKVARMLEAFIREFGDTSAEEGGGLAVVERFVADYKAYMTGFQGSIEDIYVIVVQELNRCVEKYKQQALAEDDDVIIGDRFRKRRRTESIESVIAAASSISSQLVALEIRPEKWKELQFMHVANFPQATCNYCVHPVCLQCGEGEHHLGMTCFEYLRHKLELASAASSSAAAAALFLTPRQIPARKELDMGEMDHTMTDDEDYEEEEEDDDDDVPDIDAGSNGAELGEEDEREAEEGGISEEEEVVDEEELQRQRILEYEQQLASLRWKLENSKACPHCSVLIHRDDGCNKVECLHCGYRFCWVCRRSWAENCGFFRCNASQNLEQLGEQERNDASDRPEAGVPDVLSIHARLSPTRQ